MSLYTLIPLMNHLLEHHNFITTARHDIFTRLTVAPRIELLIRHHKSWNPSSPGSRFTSSLEEVKHDQLITSLAFLLLEEGASQW